MSEDMPNTCSEEMVSFIDWLVDTFQLFDTWEYIKYVLEKPYNFYEKYQEFKKVEK